MALGAPGLTHLAPAGQTFRSIKDAGSSILLKNCPGFASNTHSYILPELLPNVYPEGIDVVTGRPTVNPTISISEHQGLVFDISGDEAERTVFHLLNSVVKKPLPDATLVLHSMGFDQKKVEALITEHPAMRSDLQAFLGRHSTGGECDFVCFVNGVGVVLIEVSPAREIQYLLSQIFTLFTNKYMLANTHTLRPPRGLNGSSI